MVQVGADGLANHGGGGNRKTPHRRRNKVFNLHSQLVRRQHRRSQFGYQPQKHYIGDAVNDTFRKSRRRQIPQPRKHGFGNVAEVRQS